MDKLISTLREYAEWADGEIWNVPITLPDVLREAADRLERQRWVPVKERMPPDGERVLTSCDDGVVRLNMAENGIFPDVVSRHKLFIKSTHWMPLPSPPKEDDDANEQETT